MDQLDSCLRRCSDRSRMDPGPKLGLLTSDRSWTETSSSWIASMGRSSDRRLGDVTTDRSGMNLGSNVTILRVYELSGSSILCLDHGPVRPPAEILKVSNLYQWTYHGSESMPSCWQRQASNSFYDRAHECMGRTNGYTQGVLTRP